MAKTPEEKAADKAAKDAAEAAIFGGAEPTHTADEIGVVQRNPAAAPDAPVVTAPAPTTHSMPSEKEDTMTLSRSQFEAIMGRMTELEGAVLSNSRGGEGDDIFNPLTAAVTEHTLKVAYHDDALVVGFKEKVKQDGRRVFTWLKKDPESQEVRTYVTLLLKDEGSEEIREETVDYVRFLEDAAVVDAKIIERKDIGKVIEQGLVNQMTWNGRALVPTSTRVMTGAKEQHWIFTVNVNGKQVQLPENVVNIKG